MDHSPLSNGLIPNPELWSLSLQLSPHTLDVMLTPPAAAHEPLLRSFTLDSATSKLKALEDVIYANPLLFSDFKSVDCFVDANRLLLLPPEATMSQCATLFSHAFPELDNIDETAEFFTTGTFNANVMQVVDPQCKSFLSRTFYNIRYHSTLASLCSYFADICSESSVAQAFPLLSRDSLTLILIQNRKLLLANKFPCYDADTAAYYTLAALTSAGLTHADVTVWLHSSLPDADTAMQVIDTLRRYCPDTNHMPLPQLDFAAAPSTLLAPFIFLIPRR